MFNIKNYHTIDSYKDNEFRDCEFSRLWVSCGGFDFRDFVVDPIFS